MPPDDFDYGAWARRQQEQAEREAGVKPPAVTAAPAVSPGPAAALGQPSPVPMTPGQSAALRGAELVGGQVLPGMVRAAEDPVNLLYGMVRGRGEPVPGLEPEQAEKLVPTGWQPSQAKTLGGFGERMLAAGGRGFGEGVPYGAAVGGLVGTSLGPPGTLVGLGSGALIGGGVGAASAMAGQAAHELFPDTPLVPEAVGLATSLINPRQAIGRAVHAVPHLGMALLGYHEWGPIGAALGWLGTHGASQVMSGVKGGWWRGPLGLQAGQERATQVGPADTLPNELSPRTGPMLIPGVPIPW